MPIANDTEDDIIYTSGDPGDPTTLGKGCYCKGDCLEPGMVVRFYSQTEEIARTPPLETSQVLVILQRDWQEYKVKIFPEQALISASAQTAI